MVLRLALFLFLLPSYSYTGLGEMNPPDFYGPIYPDYKLSLLGEVYNNNQVLLDSRINSSLDDHFFSFEQYLNHELLPAAMCTNKDFLNHKKEIHYIFRKLVLSLLFEQMIKSCELKLSFFKGCKPKSTSFKNYLKTVVSSRKTGIWDNKICKSCKSLMSCNELQSIMTSVCSEDDQLWGLNSAPTILKALKEIPTLINDINLGCFKMFSLKKRTLEYVPDKLKKQLRGVYEDISPEYPIGRMVLADELNDYKKRGITVLTGFQENIDKISIIKTKAKPMIVVTANDKTKKIIYKKDIIKKEVLKKTQQPKTAFSQAIESIKKYNFKKARVDMNQFYFDYIFSSQKIQELEKALSKFTSISTLRQMRDIDKLGSKKSPVPLLFLKFLIDTKNHKTLYGLINTLGESFYVFDDLNPIKKNEKALIELKLDEKVSFSWYLTVLNPKEIER